MDVAALGELRANAQAAIAGSPEAAEQLGASLQAAMLTASEDAAAAGAVLAELCGELLAGGAAEQALPLVAMDVLLPAARCVVASEAAGKHFQQLLNGMAASCAAREVFSAALEAVQCLASGEWNSARCALLPCLHALPPLLASITRRAHLFVPDACTAGVAVARCLGAAAAREQATMSGAKAEAPPQAIPAPTSVRVSYAEKQAEAAAGRSGGRLPGVTGEGNAVAAAGTVQAAACSFVDDYAELAAFFSELVQTTAGTSSAATDDAPTPPRCLRAAMLGILEAATLDVVTDGPGQPSCPHSAAAASMAEALLKELPRLGANTPSVLLLSSAAPGSAWEQAWGLSTTPRRSSASDSDGEDGSDDDDRPADGAEATAIKAGILLYWLLRAEEEGDGVLAQAEPSVLLSALCHGYSSLMQAASKAQSVGGALKAVHLAASSGEALAEVVCAEASTTSEEALLSCDGYARSAAPMLQSLVMTMAHHPVQRIRSAAHRALQVALQRVPDSTRLLIYTQLCESAAPAAAALLLQCVQRDTARAWSSRAGVSAGCPGGPVSSEAQAAPETGRAIFALVAQWINPDGRYGWRASLAEQAEPLFVALNFLRFMLLRQAASPPEGAPLVPEDGLRQARRDWLPALARVAAAVGDSIDAEGSMTPGGGGGAQDTMLALSLAIARVQGVTAWLLELAD